LSTEKRKLPTVKPLVQRLHLFETFNIDGTKIEIVFSSREEMSQKEIQEYLVRRMKKWVSKTSREDWSKDEAEQPFDDEFEDWYGEADWTQKKDVAWYERY
jgi:hypothetical protein